MSNEKINMLILLLIDKLLKEKKNVLFIDYI
jgi:hypothetical protein